jgi:hypothetical protein
MKVSGSLLVRGIVSLAWSAALLSSIFATPAFAQTAPPPVAAPIDPYAAPPPPTPPPVVAPPAAAPPVTNSGGNNNTTTVTANPTNTNTANPTNTVTANPTNTNNNTNDNRSTATVTNNNTIYIYPPNVTPPAPPSIPAPPLVGPPTAGMLPPLIPPPAIAAPYRGQRIRLNCAQLCARPPAPLLPRLTTLPLERTRFVSLGGHVTAFGMANQPLAGWGTLYGGGLNLTFRSRGRFGFEISQDFLRGSMRHGDSGLSLTRQSFPFEFALRGYILPNSDRYHFNMYYGGGLGVMASRVDVPFAQGDTRTQNFLEWMIHGDLGAELRFKWIAFGLEGRITGLVRDKSYGDAGYYRGIQNAPVPASTWGAEGRAYLNFWF